MNNRRGFLRDMTGMAALAGWHSAFGKNGTVTSGAKQPEPESLRAQFPTLQQRVNGHSLVYLDSAATTQRPRGVIDALSNFYLQDNANPSKSLHTLAQRSADLYENARITVAKALHAGSPREIVWTRGTTEAINLVASSWGGANLRSGDEVIVTVSDHYSCLVPWQLAARRANARVRVLDVDDDGRLRLDHLDKLLSERTRLVAFPHVSNVLGLINPVKEICERAHRAGALVLVDGAQSIPHFGVDVQALECDFFAFSGHKMCGPMGIGVLWARREVLDAMPPFQVGSNMARDVEIDSVPAHFAEGGLKFEAGTPNVPGAIGLAAAIEFLQSFDRKLLWAHEQELTRYVLASFQKITGVRILCPTEPSERISVFSFVVENRDPLEIVKTLDATGIAVRGGDLASLPLLKRMGVNSAVRASCYVYTTPEEIDHLISALQRDRQGL
jgi:cysteine desulfurase / selenocysteine lyase